MVEPPARAICAGQPAPARRAPTASPHDPAIRVRSRSKNAAAPAVMAAASRRQGRGLRRRPRARSRRPGRRPSRSRRSRGPPPRRRSSCTSAPRIRAPGGADRVAERDRAAVDVDLVLVDAEHPHRVERDRGEGLVDLPEVDVVGRLADLLQRELRRLGRRPRQVGEVVGDGPVGEHRGERLVAVGARPLLRGDDHRAGAVVDARGVARRVGGVVAADARQLRQRLDGGVGRIASSATTSRSSLLTFTVTGTISSASMPSSVALAASWWERAAQRSMSARVISSSLETSLASLIICLPVKGLVRPSWVIASIAVASPIRKPKRAPGSR